MAGQAWNLVADIGGTNARFSAILEGQLESEFEFHHSVEEYPQFSDLIVIWIFFSILDSDITF